MYVIFVFGFEESEFWVLHSLQFTSFHLPAPTAPVFMLKASFSQLLEKCVKMSIMSNNNVPVLCTYSNKVFIWVTLMTTMTILTFNLYTLFVPHANSVYHV